MNITKEHFIKECEGLYPDGSLEGYHLIDWQLDQFAIDSKTQNPADCYTDETIMWIEKKFNCKLNYTGNREYEVIFLEDFPLQEKSIIKIENLDAKEETVDLVVYEISYKLKSWHTFSHKYFLESAKEVFIDLGIKKEFVNFLNNKCYLEF